MRKAADGGPWRCLRCGAALLPARALVAELGDSAACCKLVPCVVRRHGGRLPIARFLQFDETGAGCYERLSGADPERVPRHATGNARGRCARRDRRRANRGPAPDRGLRHRPLRDKPLSTCTTPGCLHGSSSAPWRCRALIAARAMRTVTTLARVREVGGACCRRGWHGLVAVLGGPALPGLPSPNGRRGWCSRPGGGADDSVWRRG